MHLGYSRGTVHITVQAFLWILKIFLGSLFSRTSLDDCFQKLVKYMNVGAGTFLLLRKHYTEGLFTHMWVISCQREIYIWGKYCYWAWTWRYLDYKFGLCYILLDLDSKSYRQGFIIALFRYFTDVGLENIWTTYQSELRLLDFTGFRRGNT